MSNSDLNVGENKGFPFSYENSSLGATQPTLLANPGFIEKRQHKRSISEQISNPRHSHTLRHRHRRQSRGNLLDAGGVGRTINPERGSLFEGYMGEEDQEYYSDYVPHSVEGITRQLVRLYASKHLNMNFSLAVTVILKCMPTSGKRA
ncbi:unnamed protein product [Schistocephalus solidus]|uniref:Voltage-dependent N-type calcium channel subunit alpha-1B n=1 Tax=Schistocephalus solidus TaxID=70667 RepID=A0A183SEK3_SCHSO|nr:unnamed protein product [Schistocephalus solidus]